jgi:DNA-binding FadR family transcriptional regulator
MTRVHPPAPEPTVSGIAYCAPHEDGQVSRLTLKSVEDLFLTWHLIGPEIARIGVREATGQQADRLRRLICELGAVGDIQSARARTARFLEIAVTMFDLLAVATRNDRMLETYRCLDGEMSCVWSLLIASPAGPELARRASGTDWQLAAGHHDGGRAAEMTHDFIELSQIRTRELLRTGNVILLPHRAGAVRTE